MEPPKFLNQVGFTKPFSSKGEPKKYLALLTPFLEKNLVSRNEMLESAGINPDEVTVGHYSTTFSKLNSSKIITYDSSLKKWRKGENWFQYLSWVLINLCKYDAPRNKFVHIFKRYTANSTNLIVDLGDED